MVMLEPSPDRQALCYSRFTKADKLCFRLNDGNFFSIYTEGG